jgi:predicted enzyme related to lactoylglutathione lyase
MRHIALVKTSRPCALATALILAGTFWMSAQAMFGQEKPPQAEPAGPYILNLLWVTDNLERAEAFYHRLLGLESPDGDPRARLVWYAQVPFLDDMYGVKGNTRNFFLHVPGSDLALEPEQFSGAAGKRLDTHIQDPGAVQLIFTVSNIDQLATWLTEGGAKALSAGGKPLSVTDASGSARTILFQDFNGFFVKLVQRDAAPKDPAGPNGAPPSSFVNGVSIGVTIDDTEKTARFYHDVLGVDVRTDASFSADAKQLDAFGLTGAQYRESAVAFPEKTPPLHFFEFKGVARKPLHPLPPDPNSALIRIAVHDMDGVIARVKPAGGQIMNASGGATPNGKARWLIVTDPNGAHLQLVDRNALP